MTRGAGGPRSGGSPVLKAARVAVLLGLAVLAGLVIAGLVPLAAGYSAHVVTSGSMAPRVHPGDVVVTHPVTAAELRAGQVLLLHDPERPGGLLLHRLVSFDEEGRLVTRGDANQSDDSVHADPASVRGLAVLRVPWVGLPALWRMQGRAGTLAVTAGVLVAAAVFASTGGRRRAAEAERDDQAERPDDDTEVLTGWDLPIGGDPGPVRETSYVRRLPPVPAPRRAAGGSLPPVPAARSGWQPATSVGAALPVHPTSGLSSAVRLPKAEAGRSAAVRSSAWAAVTTTGGQGSSAPSTRHHLPPVPPADPHRDDRGAAARAPRPRVRPAGDHDGRADGGHDGGRPRR